MSSLQQLALELFDAGAVRLGDIEAKIGRRTPVYFDLRVVVSHPRIMSAVAEHLQRLASEINHDLLCGVPYAALPFTAVMSVNTDVPMIMKRKETKLYATRKLIEGVYHKNQTCLVVEDVVTSGGSVLETVRTLRDEQLNVTHAIVVLDREQGGVSVLKANGVKVVSLFTLNNLTQILRDAGRITDDTVDIISDHIKGCQFGVMHNSGDEITPS
ncbi:uridine 5'-monophosphate synthase-like [Ostrinia furnacalis]|uniref:uridine 5'-monophosphate synthase-like n=1 Tax=Ostrinia furnacalis TaxID=93504 RepID=UPI001039E8C1|nr:uridine 5'-monophosphate synthase-like [Ostrinia furnacalis]XP_028174706.1 uridine 5'-monophosphate synthase-like [Ostrinia furnacalis]XP_028174707.1 uridine 5'-monophosphate synthase-like [Ostrinia furnacalis]